METSSQMNAKTSGKKPGQHGYIVYIEPPVKLSAKARPMYQKKFNPVLAAEKQVEITSKEFGNWLEMDQKTLARTWQHYATTPQDNDAFIALNKAVHVIKGNAPILGCAAAGMLASPLATLLERCTNHHRVESVVYLAINAICTAIEEKLPASDETLKEIAIQLHRLNSRCLKIKTQAADSTSICSSSCEAMQ